MTTCLGLYFPRPPSGRKYPLSRKLYNVCSVVSVSLNRHFVNEIRFVNETYITEYFTGIQNIYNEIV